MVTIALDLDDTLWEFNKPILKKYNERYNDCLELEDITDWDIRKFIKSECQSYYSEFATEELFRDDIKIAPQVVEILTKLNEKTQLFFCSACASKTVPWRFQVLQKYLPWIKDEQFVKLSDKSKFKCNILVDDNIHNCLNCDDIGLLINQPWNSNRIINTTKVRRVENISEALNLVMNIV